MLFPRIMTILVGLPFLLAAIYMGSLPFFFLVLGIACLSLREFYYLAEESGYPCYRWMGLAAGVLMVSSVFLNGLSFGAVTDNQATSALVALFLAGWVLRALSRGPSETLLSEWGVTFFGVFYVAWTLSHLLLLRDLRPSGQSLTFFLFTMIWAGDILAYLVGSQWGRHRMSPVISPKKTWEGTLGGVLGAMAVAVVFQMTLLRQQMKWPEALLVGAGVGLLAMASDLGESLLKRSAGVKDSSPLLPGHGGVLDRFDSFFLTAPLFYYYWAFFKH